MSVPGQVSDAELRYPANLQLTCLPTSLTFAHPMPCQPRKKVFIGSFVHALSLRKLQYLRNTLLAVDEEGVIAFVVSDSDGKPQTGSNGTNGAEEQAKRGIQTEDDVHFILSQHGWEASETQIVWLKRGEFIIPG